MSASKRLLLIFSTIVFWQGVFVFLAAQHACEWGLPAYFWFGVSALIALIILPFFTHRGEPLKVRILSAVGYACAQVGIWVLGILAADMQLLCRLF